MKFLWRLVVLEILVPGMVLAQATGIMHPGGSLTLNVLGKEVLRATKDGYVGIGTTAPDALVSLGGSSAQVIDMVRNPTSGTAGNGLTLQAGGATVGGTNLAGGDLNLASGVSTGTGLSQINFKVPTGDQGSTTDNPFVTAMTMRNFTYHQPQVSIGTTSFQDSLFVYGNGSGTGNGHIVVQNANSTGNGYGAVIIQGDAWPLFTVGEASSGFNNSTGVPALSAFAESQTSLEFIADGTGGSLTGIRFLTGGANSSNERMRIDNSGSVGIGITTPTTALEISGTVSATNVVVAGTMTLPKYTSAPVTCGATYRGMIAMTSTTIAECNGTNWVLDRTNATFTW